MPESQALLLVVAHPDDEIIGAGIRLSRQQPVTILYVTDGAPLDPWWASQAGFGTRQEYSDARRRERAEALAIAGIHPSQCRDFNYADQDAYLHLQEITKRLAELIDEIRPEVILTHPYEGGHPDHDACAFAVRHAMARVWPLPHGRGSVSEVVSSLGLSASLVQNRDREGAASEARPRIEEFACYHGGPTGFQPQDFLPSPEPVSAIALDPDERERKQRMYDCHRTQQHVLSLFSTIDEKFRPAPAYDFTKPPHEGELHYETLGWGITGEMWREKAAQATELLKPDVVWV